MADVVTICNLALGSIGARTSIASLTENSNGARECALQYPSTLEAVLSAAHWNFARAQVALSLLKDASATPPGTTPSPWIYEYAYPADCVTARYIMPTFSSAPSSVPGTVALPSAGQAPVRFLISTDLDAGGNRIKVILTNQPEAELVYTARVEDTTLFDGNFTLALANYLGSRLCIPLAGDKALAKSAFELADRLTKQAQASNGNEGLMVIDNIPDWIRVRGYAADWAYPPGSMYFLAPQSLTLIM